MGNSLVGGLARGRNSIWVTELTQGSFSHFAVTVTNERLGGNNWMWATIKTSTALPRVSRLWKTQLSQL
jgi:hypothetical protein